MSESSIEIRNSQAIVMTQPNISRSDIFGILQNDRRRCVLEILRSKGSQSMRSLSEEIARLESETEEPKSSVRKSIYVSLLQTHIPKMESLEIICYDRENDIIELLPAAQSFNVYMETVKKGDIPWSQFYLGLSILSIIGSVIIFAGLIKWISSFHWMLFTNAVILTASVSHVLHMRKP